METSETSETRQLQGERSEPWKLLQKLQNWKERNCWCHQQLLATNNWIIFIHSSSSSSSSIVGLLLLLLLKIDFRSHKRVNGRSERFKVSKSIYSPSATTFDFIAKPLTPTCQAQIDRKENENDGLPSSALGWKWKPVPTLCSQGRTSSQLHKTIKWPNFWHVRDNWKISKPKIISSSTWWFWVLKFFNYLERVKS